MRDEIIDAIATYRLTRLIARDSFPPVARVREWWWSKHPPPNHEIEADGFVVVDDSDAMQIGYPVRDGRPLGFTVSSLRGNPPYYAEGTALGELVECSWCVSMWLGLTVITARRIVPRVWDPIAKALAFSAVAGLVSQLEQE